MVLAHDEEICVQVLPALKGVHGLFLRISLFNNICLLESASAPSADSSRDVRRWSRVLLGARTGVANGV